MWCLNQKFEFVLLLVCEYYHNAAVRFDLLPSRPCQSKFSRREKALGGTVRAKFRILEEAVEPLGSNPKNLGKSTATKYDSDVRAK